MVKKTLPSKITIIGAGAMGSALAVLLSERNEVNLWGSEFDTALLDLIKRGKEHPRIGAKIPGNVKLFSPKKLEDSLKGRNLIVLGVSTEGIKEITGRIEPYLSGKEIIISVTKGLIQEGKEILTAYQYLEEKLKNPIVAIAGPSIAKEVANRNHTKVVFASGILEAAEEAKEIFETDYYFVETSEDTMGAELASAFKNIYSISLAWPKGMESQKKVKTDNLKGLIMTQALKELAAIAEHFGGKKETVYGLAGLGDIVCTVGSGRNGMLGELLGKGKTASQALKILEEKRVGAIEGYQNFKKARSLIKEIENDLPLFKELYKVLFLERKVERSLKELMA